MYIYTKYVTLAQHVLSRCCTLRSLSTTQPLFPPLCLSLFHALSSISRFYREKKKSISSSGQVRRGLHPKRSCEHRQTRTHKTRSVNQTRPPFPPSTSPPPRLSSRDQAQHHCLTTVHRNCSPGEETRNSRSPDNDDDDE